MKVFKKYTKKYGYYKEELKSITLKGIDGMGKNKVYNESF